jgi:hypothetical protein
MNAILRSEQALIGIRAGDSPGRDPHPGARLLHLLREAQAEAAVCNGELLLFWMRQESSWRYEDALVDVIDGLDNLIGPLANVVED